MRARSCNVIGREMNFVKINKSIFMRGFLGVLGGAALMLLPSAHAAQTVDTIFVNGKNHYR